MLPNDSGDVQCSWHFNCRRNVRCLKKYGCRVPVSLRAAAILWPLESCRNSSAVSLTSNTGMQRMIGATPLEAGLVMTADVVVDRRLGKYTGTKKPALGPVSLGLQAW